MKVTSHPLSKACNHGAWLRRAFIPRIWRMFLDPESARDDFCDHADDEDDRRGSVRSSLAKELTFFEKVKGRWAFLLPQIPLPQWCFIRSQRWDAIETLCHYISYAPKPMESDMWYPAVHAVLL